MTPRVVRAAFVALVVAGSFGTTSSQAQSSASRVGAAYAVVMEVDSGDIAFARGADVKRPIASTTKLMTALLTLENLDRKKLIRASAYHPDPAETTINLVPGEEMRVADLLRALLLASANDAAMTLAHGVSGSEPAFVRLMNRRAAQLGLTHTHYANPIGLDDPANYSSARDLVKLAKYLQRFEFFRKTVRRSSALLKSGNAPRRITNRNTLVRDNSWITGVKTGHTSSAGFVLVGSSQRRGVNLISAVLGTPSEQARNTDTLTLLRWASTLYRPVKPVRKGDEYAQVPIAYRRGALLALVADRTHKYTVRKGEKLTTRVVGLPDEVVGPVERGQKIATVEVWQRSKRVASIPLVAQSSVPEAGLAQKAKNGLTDPLVLVGVIVFLVGLALMFTARPQVFRTRRPRRGPIRSER